MRRNLEIGRTYMNGSLYTFAYDGDRNQTVAAPYGLGETTFAFDSLDRLSGRTDLAVFTQKLTYDGANRRLGLTDPDGGIITTSWDSANRLVGLFQTDNTRYTLVYDLANRLVGQTEPSGLQTTWTLDGANQTVGAEDALAGAVDNVWTFVYDPVASRTVVRDLQGNWTTYGYDSKNRLISDTTTGPNAHQYAYTYDSMDNRLASNETGFVTSWNYNLASQITTALSNVGVFTYGYDPKGNEISVNSQGALATMQYDYENRLSFYLDSSNAATYLYYTNNMKAIELLNGARTSLIWDGTDYLQGRS
jgi:YD repeat-containing protein